jgi:hypothetical protein
VEDGADLCRAGHSFRWDAHEGLTEMLEDVCFATSESRQRQLAIRDGFHFRRWGFLEMYGDDGVAYLEHISIAKDHGPADAHPPEVRAVGTA